MRYVIGVDGGGTKTAAVLMREDGAILARGRGGPANHNFVPPDAVVASVEAAVAEVCRGLPPGAAVSAIGGHVLAPVAVFAAVLARLCGSAPYHNWGEAEVAAVGLVGKSQPGVVVIAGTGSQATGFCGAQRKSAGGWGTPLGDEGGAGYIGWRALQAATRAYDGRTPPTALLDAIYAHFGIQDLWALIPLLYRGTLPRHQIAALAPLVARCAEAGDATAREIMHQAGEELALLAATAARHVGLSGSAFPVVLAGGVFRAGEVLLEPLRAALRAREPLAATTFPRFASEVGAALLTLEACGVSLTEALFARAAAMANAGERHAPAEEKG